MAAGIASQFFLSRRDRPRFSAPGILVPVPGAKMHIYAKGEGPSLVLLSGWGTAVPSVDFQPLMDALAEHYRVIVLEKPGYGFSSDTRVPRTLPAIVSELRAALAAASETGPYLLCAHSMAGCEAVYWACRHPEEVRGIAMLDAPAPLCYQTLPTPPAAMWQLCAFARFVGLRRLFLRFPFFVRRYRRHLNGYKYLSPALMPIERAMQATRYTSRPMREEIRRLKENSKAAGGAVPSECKVLALAASDTKKRWSMLQPEEDAFLERNGALAIELEGKHNLQHYAPGEIARHILAYFEKEGAP